jgi:hypothetical protein
MRTFALLMLVAFAATRAAAASPEAPAPPTHALRIAVYKLEAVGVAPQVARVAEQALLAELRKLQRSSVLSYDEVQSMIDHEAQQQLLGCSESSCLAEIAEALGADVLITGSMIAVAKQVQLAWKRIEPATASVTQTYTKSVLVPDGETELSGASAGAEEILALIGPAVAQLFPDLPLRPNTTRGVDPALALRLNPPPLDPWVMQTTAVVSAVALLATGSAGVLWAVSAANLQSTYDGAKAARVSADQVIAQQQQTSISNTAFWVGVGVTVVTAAATGVLVPFTDFAGMREQEQK